MKCNFHFLHKNHWFTECCTSLNGSLDKKISLKNLQKYNRCTSKRLLLSVSLLRGKKRELSKFHAHPTLFPQKGIHAAQVICAAILCS